jgi:transcriptional regulator with XRE-family HTH domain
MAFMDREKPLAMSQIHDQLRARRLQLGLQQSDMHLRAGLARQQYHRLEKGGNPSLKTLELAAAGLNMVLLLVPRERLREVRELLARPSLAGMPDDSHPGAIDNPWTNLLGSSDDD